MKPKLQLDHTRVGNKVFFVTFRTDDFSTPQPEWPAPSPEYAWGLSPRVHYFNNGQVPGAEDYECACVITVFSQTLPDVIRQVEDLRKTFDLVGYPSFKDENADLLLQVNLNNALQMVLSC